MKLVRFTLPMLVLAGTILLNNSPSYAKPEYTKTEKKPCVTCHVAAKSKELNKTGECYKTEKSLAKCETK